MPNISWTDPTAAQDPWDVALNAALDTFGNAINATNGTATPQALGSASPGTHTGPAAAVDHVHPTTGVVTTAALSSATPGATATSGGAGSSTNVSRADHVHASPQLTSSTPAATAASGTVGVATDVARSDHAHASPQLTSSTPAATGASGAVGVATSASRADHVHAVTYGTSAGTAAQGTDPRIVAAYPVINLTSYLGVCDGQVGYYGQATASSATLTDPTANFTSALIGKTFTMPGAGAAGGIWTGTINAVPTSTTLTISATAGTTSQISGTAGGMTSGQNLLTDAGTTFTQAQMGAIVTVTGAGAGGTTLTGQLLTPSVNGHAVYLISTAQLGNQNNAQNASTTVSGANWTLNRGMYTIGTDDTTAWTNALSAAAAVIATSGAATIAWSGMSMVSSQLTVLGGVQLRGVGSDPSQPGTAYPTQGSIIRAHGAFSGTAVLRLGQFAQYREDSMGGGLRDCTIDAANVATWAVWTSGNWYTMDRVVARNGTTGAVWLNGWQTMMRDCSFMQPGAGDCLRVAEADAQMIGGYLKSGANMLHCVAGANDFCMAGVHIFNSWAAAVGGTNNNVLIDQACSRITLTACYFDNVYGPQVQIKPPAGGNTVSEVEFYGCKFFEAGSLWYSFPDNTYPILNMDTSADAGATIERVIMAGCSGSAVGSTSRFSAIANFTVTGPQRSVTIGDTTVNNCVAIYTGSSPSQVSFSHVKAQDTGAGAWRTSPWPLGTQGAGGNPFTATGNGSTTAFNVAHNMNGTPKRVSVLAQTTAAAAPFFVTVSTTNVTITYNTAPANAAALAWWITAEL